jgi:hypothetical protein
MKIRGCRYRDFLGRGLFSDIVPWQSCWSVYELDYTRLNSPDNGWMDLPGTKRKEIFLSYAGENAFSSGYGREESF